MRLTIKILGRNEEFAIFVPDALVDVGRLKVLLERNKGIPVQSQRILYKGRALADSKTIQDYGITENSKLHLSIKAIGETKGLSNETPNNSKNESISNGDGDFFKRLERVLYKHFSEGDAEKVLSKFSEVYAGFIDVLSLDCIERIAKHEMEKCNARKEPR